MTAAVDDFADYAHTGIEAPAGNAAAVTPSDGTDLGHVTRALYVGGSGDLALITQHGQTVTLKNTVAGSMLPIRVARVKAIGTTASNIVAFW